MDYKISQLLANNSSKDNSFNEIYIAQPNTEKELAAGKLFALLEINIKKSQALKLADFMIDYIERSYYQDEKISLTDKIPSLKIENIFEALVSRTNKSLLEFIKREKIKISSRSFNVTIGLVYENNIYFANSGDNKSFLIHKEDKGTNEGNVAKYKMNDIGKNSDPENKKNISHKEKLFSNIISGLIPKNGYMFFTNEALPEYLSKKQLLGIITKLSPVGAAEQIKNTIESINIYVPFLGVIIKNTQLTSNIEHIQEQHDAFMADNDSIVQLQATEKATEEILSPTGLIKVRGFVDFFKDTLKKISSTGSDTNKIFLEGKTHLEKRSFLKKWSKKIWIITKGLTIYILNFIFYLLKTITNKDRIISSYNSLKRFYKNIKNQERRSIKEVKLKYKIALLLVAVFLAWLTFNIYNNKKEVASEEKLADYQGLITLIEEKQNKAEANLLFKNEDNAKKLFEEIEDLLTELPQDTPEHKKQHDSFYDKFNKQLDKVRRIEKVDKLNEEIDFSKLNENGNQANIKNLILLGENLVSANSSKKSVYFYDTNKKLVTAHTDNAVPLIAYPSTPNGSFVYWYAKDSIVKTDNNSAIAIPLSSKDGTDIVAMSSYSNRLYLLDKANGQIWRYVINNTAFSSPLPWLNHKADLSNSVDIAIDGFVWILNKDGSIDKFLRGAPKDDFKLAEANPKITEASQLQVSNTLDFIYILEAKTKRILVYYKNGDFVKQYDLSDIESPNSFTVDEKNKKIYVLGNGKVWSFAANHFD